MRNDVTRAKHYATGMSAKRGDEDNKRWDL